MSIAINDDLAPLRQLCRGVLPLTGRMESWMQRALSDPQLEDAMARYGSPLNLLWPAGLVRNADRLKHVAERHGVDFDVYFARKANKAISFVDAARRHGLGIDTASFEELQQVLQCGYERNKIICTAAVKSQQLIELCVDQSVTLAVDNVDELDLVHDVAKQHNRNASTAIRFSGFLHESRALRSRFGFDVSESSRLLGRLNELREKCGSHHAVQVDGLHFHLDGYSGAERVSALRQLLPIAETFRAQGHPINFVDIGGGIPMSYLESEQEWLNFWRSADEALLGHREPITYRNHGLGRVAVEGRVHGDKNVYPYWQTPTATQWLTEVLTAPDGNSTIAETLVSMDLELRCEPGRSLLDGCGMTVARVEYVKRHHDGYLLVGLAMNRTQCRTTTDDFLVDPIVLPAGGDRARQSAPQGGYLVGAYCTESELLSLRRLEFPEGICRGDRVVFVNTAGYLMHFLESRSHQFPLAKNLCEDPQGRWRLDPIDE